MSKKVVFEDATMSYNRWVQGIASREQNSGKVTLFDLFDKQTRQFPGSQKEEVYIPPTLSNISTLLGNIVVNNANLQDKMRQTWSMPFCKEHKSHREIVKSAYEKMKQIDQIIQQITKDFDTLVEKPKEPTKIEKDEAH